MNHPLPWQVVWITGASSGIGLEIARQLAESGVKVAVSSRSRPDGLNESNVVYFPLDVTDSAAAESCVSEIERILGPIDLAVLCAGTYKPFEAGAIATSDFKFANQVNYLGITNCISALVPRMMKRGKGHVSWCASVAGYRGLPKAAYYGPTKAALINLAECLHLELEPLGVKISVINPGFVETPMTSVNDFRMPFLMKPPEAARRTIQGLAKSKFEIAYPTRFIAVMKALRVLPAFLYFSIAKRTRQDKRTT